MAENVFQVTEREGMTLGQLRVWLDQMQTNGVPDDAKPEALVRWNGTIRTIKVKKDPRVTAR